jgi:hypothetical protein
MSGSGMVPGEGFPETVEQTGVSPTTPPSREKRPRQLGPFPGTRPVVGMTPMPQRVLVYATRIGASTIRGLQTDRLVAAGP